MLRADTATSRSAHLRNVAVGALPIAQRLQIAPGCALNLGPLGLRHADPFRNYAPRADVLADLFFCSSLLGSSDGGRRLGRLGCGLRGRDACCGGDRDYRMINGHWRAPSTDRAIICQNSRMWMQHFCRRQTLLDQRTEISARPTNRIDPERATADKARRTESRPSTLQLQHPPLIRPGQRVLSAFHSKRALAADRSSQNRRPRRPSQSLSGVRSFA